MHLLWLFNVSWGICFFLDIIIPRLPPSGSVVKNPTAVQETQVQSLGREDPMEEEMVTHSSILAWEMPWTEEPDRPQFMGSRKSQTSAEHTHPWGEDRVTRRGQPYNSFRRVAGPNSSTPGSQAFPLSPFSSTPHHPLPASPLPVSPPLSGKELKRFVWK